MNFGAQMSRFSHLLTLKIFRIKQKQCKFLFPTLKGHSPALRTVGSSGITSASAQGLFLLLPQVTALPLPCSELHCPPPCGSTSELPAKHRCPQPGPQAHVGQRGRLCMNRASVPSYSVHLLQLLLLAGEHLLQEHCKSRKQLAPEGWWDQQNVGCKLWIAVGHP